MPETPATRIALYPGTFDPIHNGHIDIITRGARLVDKLFVGVAVNIGKGPLFPLEERVGLIAEECAEVTARIGVPIEVRPFEGLVIHFAREIGATTLVRGLRAVSDFDFEFLMAGMNHRLGPEVDTVFLMASERHQFISSRFVKEVAQMGGDISSFVSARTLARTTARLAAA
jgi:pantetheine-phosphate adenylyltransferase